MTKTVYRILKKAKHNGNRYDKITTEDDYEVVYPDTDVPLPEELASKPAGYNWDTGWYDNSLEAAQVGQEAAEKQVTLKSKQLAKVGAVLGVASSIISTPEVAATITDEQAVSLADLWPTWAVGSSYAKGQVVIYDGQQYRHHADSTELATEQLNPADADYLWTPITISSDGVITWVKPTGYEDAYAKGVIVKYTDGKYYQSQYDGNDQEPGGNDPRFWIQVNADGSAVTTETSE